MSLSKSLQLKLNPANSKYETGDWGVITGSGFGNTMPNMVLYDPCQALEGQLIKTNTPVIGNYLSTSANCRAVMSGGEPWMPFRDPTQLASSARNLCSVAFLAPQPFTQFFWYCRLMAQDGAMFPFATSVNGIPVWSDCNMKPWWFTDPSNSTVPPDIGKADQVIPNFNANGINLFGNSNSVIKAGGGGFAFPNQTGSWDTHAPAGFSHYQSGDESVSGAKDASVKIQRIDSNGNNSVSSLADPFQISAGLVDPPYYQYLAWVGYSDPNPASGTWANTQMLTNGAYLATGPNCRASVIWSEAPTIEASKNVKHLPPVGWVDNQIVFPKMGIKSGYFHLQLADGSVDNNKGVY